MTAKYKVGDHVVYEPLGIGVVRKVIENEDENDPLEIGAGYEVFFLSTGIEEVWEIQLHDPIS